MRSGFTLVEVLIASAILSVISLVMTDLIVSETRHTAAIMEDLGINKESRFFFQLLSRDVRSATEILVKPEQMVPENDTAMMGLVQDPVDLTRCRLTLMKNLPAGTIRKERIDYWLVSETGPPAGMPTKSRAVQAAKVKTYLQGGAPKRLYPLVRTLSTVAESGVAHLEDDQLVGTVRGLAFYQVVPASTGTGQRPVLPTVYATLVMSAFKPAVGQGYEETYRQKLAVGFTARAIVASVLDNTVPDQSDPDPGD